MTQAPRQYTALVTGGARGIGRAIVEELQASGVSVLSPPRRELDLAAVQSVESWLRSHRDEKVDILVNNAGTNVLNAVTDIDLATWEAMAQVNLRAVLRLVQIFAPGMVARGWGRILNLSSIFSLVTKERRAAYSMTKAALNALTRSAAVEYGPGGVLVNALAPGYVDTDLTRQNNSPEALAQICGSIPLRRMASVAELAKIAGFLVSEANSYLTGQVVVVDGGFTCL
jgi:NAD(P)-dependent dehydrogenase (short-subunit alcohol dehydrogenase family)